MKNSEKMRSLCEELNMSFDEASELFSEETLQSMQMAKIVGGNTNAGPWRGLWRIFCELVGAADAFLNILQKAITGSDIATVAPDTEITLTINSDGSKTVTAKNLNSVQFIEKGDTVQIIGIVTPTPKPE